MQPPFLLLVLIPLLVAGCASTTTARLVPSPQAPICQRDAAAHVFWVPRWRADQKDVAAREAAAAEGLNNFFKASACFASASVLRLPQPATGVTQDVLDKARARGEKVVLIGVRELGPTVSIGASWALVEGATEVVLDVTEYVPSSPMHRTFAVHWRSGGPGVLKGVAGLPQDMQAALAAALQPAAK